MPIKKMKEKLIRLVFIVKRMSLKYMKKNIAHCGNIVTYKGFSQGKGLFEKSNLSYNKSNRKKGDMGSQTATNASEID